MKFIGYCRVSSASQEDNTSLDEQQRKIELHADMHGHDLVACLRDVFTGTTLGRKGLWYALRKLVCTRCVPQWQKAPWLPTVEQLTAPCACLVPQPADGLIVWTLDRLSRDSRDITMLVHDVLAATGKSLVVISGMGQCDTTTPSGRLILGIFAQLAQFDRENIKEKLRAGWEAAKRNGKYASGSPPYGWVAVGGELVEDAEQQAVISAMQFMRSGGFTVREIADVLNCNAVPSKRGKKWNYVGVHQVLRGPRRQLSIQKAG